MVPSAAVVGVAVIWRLSPNPVALTSLELLRNPVCSLLLVAKQHFDMERCLNNVVEQHGPDPRSPACITLELTYYKRNLHPCTDTSRARRLALLRSWSSAAVDLRWRGPFHNRLVGTTTKRQQAFHITVIHLTKRLDARLRSICFRFGFLARGHMYRRTKHLCAMQQGNPMFESWSAALPRFIFVRTSAR